MAKKESKKASDFIEGIRADVNMMVQDVEIPDIITFIEGEEWLAFPHHPSNPIYLYPLQRIMLKIFYRGSVGNENLTLTDEEVEICRQYGLNNVDKGDLISKYESGDIFRELVLVWGRRSGKDFIVSIIAAYEAMKLLECHGGDPYAMYELSSATPFNILTVANSAKQANIAFEEIRERILRSPYFSDKYLKDGITSNSVYLLTPKDKEENRDMAQRGLSPKKGSVCIVVGHSNSDTLLGMGCIVLILDEVASYKMTGSSSSGDRIYAALTPTVQTYVKKTYSIDENGEQILDGYGQRIVANRRYDGKVISISSPRAKEGKFYELFRDAPSVSTRLAMRCPTWDVNPTHTRQSLRNDNHTLSEIEFNMEFGAEFSGVGLEQFFTEEQVNSAFKGHNYRLVDVGSPGRVYFIHIDPATNSHNYAVLVLHKEFFFNQETNQADYKIIVDHIKYWQPIRGPINPEEVIQYIIGLKKRFHIGMISYDQWASAESIIALRKAGIPNKITQFTSKYKANIYRELENLVNAGKVCIPYEEKSVLLYNEMIELQRKFTPTGFKIQFKKDGDGVKSDDIVDCLAGAAFVAVDSQAHKLPQSRLVDLGNPVSNSRTWQGMQGPLGTGTGQQVTNAFESRSRAFANLNRYGRFGR